MTKSGQQSRFHLELLRLLCGLALVGIELPQLLDDDGLIEPHVMTKVDSCCAARDNEFPDFVTILEERVREKFCAFGHP